MTLPFILVLRGFAFIIIGVLKVLCDRWLLETRAQGSKTFHPFNHVFFLTFVCQFFQMLALPFYFAIEKNWLGCGRLRHGEMIRRAHPNHFLYHLRRNMAQAPAAVDAANANPAEEVEGEGDQGGGPSIQADGPVPMPDVQDVAVAPVAEIPAVPEGVVAIPERQEDPEEEEARRRRRRRRSRPSKFLYLMPAICALGNYLLLHFGLSLTYSSSFIMLKGTVSFFTAVLVMAFLAQQLAGHVWFGILVSILGFAVTGLSNYFYKPKESYEKYGIAAGDLLIVIGQIFTATKLVYEEKFFRKYSIHPLKFLGGEGVYGFILSGIALPPLCLVPVASYFTFVVPGTKHLEDVTDAATQIYNSYIVDIAFAGSVVLHVLWNYLGMFLVRDHGALRRVMVESLVWTIYWAVCLGLSWESFVFWQIPSLCAIVVGLLFYSNILPLPCCDRQAAEVNRNALYPNRGAAAGANQAQNGAEGEGVQNNGALVIEEEDGDGRPGSDSEREDPEDTDDDEPMDSMISHDYDDEDEDLLKDNVGFNQGNSDDEPLLSNHS